MLLLISLLLVLVFYLFYVTKPSPDSFRTFITQRYSQLQEEGGKASYGAIWIKNFAAQAKAKARGQRSSLDFTWKNYQLFSVVKLKDGSAIYLGYLNRWSLISEASEVKVTPAPVAGSSRNDGLDYSRLGSDARDKAKDALSKKKYVSDSVSCFPDKEAGSRFQEAGEAFMKIGDDLSTREAAICFEEAYNAYKHTKYSDKALQALKDAATVFDSTKKDPNRTGKLYEKIGEYYEKANAGKQKKTELVMAFGCLQESYRVVSNGKHFFKYSLIHQAELAAQIGHYDEAIPWFEELCKLSVDDPMLTYKVRGFLFQACICMVALEEWTRVSIAYKEYGLTYPSFLDSDEYRLINSLVEATLRFDTNHFTEAYKQYHNVMPLPNWMLAVLSRAATAVQYLDGSST
ncbi:TPR-like protein [Basidiobolus meristosporus CBS 931.73]|uniref:TPR-like protein n=1 Tax=Basidiobolus meristosporus CBS 931.73 TaxID=1314790 RepID=A0A1Y1YB01_9FUNG|nr:TPR-like protein [Basidiobolus meristosporus CBS 931.73]|eukprot:ORX94946.1 TPR-like protein [Basidiobolus meristosporus CBS 931.73]